MWAILYTNYRAYQGLAIGRKALTRRQADPPLHALLKKVFLHQSNAQAVDSYFSMLLFHSQAHSCSPQHNASFHRAMSVCGVKVDCMGLRQMCRALRQWCSAINPLWWVFFNSFRWSSDTPIFLQIDSVQCVQHFSMFFHGEV